MSSEDFGTGRPAAWPWWVVAFVALVGAVSVAAAVVAWAGSGPSSALSPAVAGVMLVSLAVQGTMRRPVRVGGLQRYWRDQSPGFLVASAIALLAALGLIFVSVQDLA
jgi:hypothetical protein